MQDLTFIGIDLGKHSFQVHGQDRQGKALLRKKSSRKQLIDSSPHSRRLLVQCARAYMQRLERQSDAE
jgi:hypothetical protein